MMEPVLAPLCMSCSVGLKVMQPKKYYAHTKSNHDGSPAPQSEWQPLDEHLKNVASLAAGFAESFGLSSAGELIGLCHRNF